LRLGRRGEEAKNKAEMQKKIPKIKMSLGREATEGKWIGKIKSVPLIETEHHSKYTFSYLAP